MTVEHTQSVANHGEVERKELPIGSPNLIPSLMGALPEMVPLSTSKGVSRKRVDTIMGLMALPIVINDKKNPLWDMCAGDHNVPAPPHWSRGTPAGGAIPWQQDFLTSREVHAGLREQYDMDRIKGLCGRPGPAYSCAILGSGALGCTTAAVASLFKP